MIEKPETHFALQCQILVIGETIAAVGKNVPCQATRRAQTELLFLCQILLANIAYKAVHGENMTIDHTGTHGFTGVFAEPLRRAFERDLIEQCRRLE